MPGLVGIVLNDFLDKQIFHRMVNSINHENFCKTDVHVCSSFGIARVHLGIFNPEPQPIFSENRSLCIFMDGKIYDYEDHMIELKKRGYKFNNENDPEFCLNSYAEYGSEFIKNLNGSFLFIIYDFKYKKIIIVNDRYGQRPFYFTKNDYGFLFASEVKAILEDKNFEKELNDAAVADFFAFGKIFGNKTFLKGINVLPPASILTYDGQNLSIEQYWDFNYKPDYSKSKKEFGIELAKTFKRAVEIRMKDNLRYGISLSGGLDSRSVAGAISENKIINVLAYSFGPLDCDEVRIAKKVAKKAGSKFKEISIGPESIMDNAEREIYYSDGMDYIGVSYLLPIHRMIRNDVDVVFTGLTLDTTIANPYLNQDIMDANDDTELFYILFKKWRFFSDEELRNLFVGDYYSKIKSYPLRAFEEAFNKIKDDHPGNKADHFELVNHTIRWALMGHVLMRPFLEDSIPGLDNNFVDIALRIPPELRLNYRVYSEFLKKLSPDLAKICYNKTMIRADAPWLFWKAGMYFQDMIELSIRKICKLSKGEIIIPKKRSYVNFDDWFRTNENWKLFFRENMLGENAASKRYFNQDFIKKLFEAHVSGQNNNSLKLMYLLSFELFLRLFVNENSSNSNISSN